MAGGSSGWTPRVWKFAWALFMLAEGVLGFLFALEPGGRSEWFGTGLRITPAGWGFLSGIATATGLFGVASFLHSWRRPDREDAARGVG